MRFADFELDPRSAELRRNGTPIKLQEQPARLLLCLLEHPGEIVSREELRQRLWPNEFVDFDHSLNAAVRKLREALGDSADEPRFIETLSRRGYRFIAPVTPIDARPRFRMRLLPFAAAAVVIAGGFAMVRKAPPDPRLNVKAIAVLPFTSSETSEVADRTTEKVIDSLSASLPHVRVMARASVFGFQGTKLDPWKVGSILGCDAVVLGQISRSGDSFVARVEMIEVRSGAELWGDHLQVKSAGDLPLLISEKLAKQLR